MSLTDELRRMVGAGPAEYSLGGTTYWTDEQLQALVERSAIQRAGLPVDVSVVETFSGARSILFGNLGSIGFLDVDGDTGTITDRNGDEVEALISAYGAVSFDSDVYDVNPVVWAGTSYDFHGAAAEVLEGWLAYAGQSYDITLDGQSLRRSQATAALQKRLDYHRSQALGEAGGGQVESVETSAPLW